MIVVVAVDDAWGMEKTAFNVAGFIAGRVFGQPFEDAARTHALEPLGMADAAFTPHRVGPGVATPYGSIVPPGVGPKPANRVRLVATPMGGLTTNVLDLARFGQMVLNGGEHGGRRILSTEVLSAATTTILVALSYWPGASDPRRNFGNTIIASPPAAPMVTSCASAFCPKRRHNRCAPSAEPSDMMGMAVPGK